MPATSRLLYYELGVRADDDGFVEPNKVIRMMALSVDDLKVLITKGFAIPFESGVVVLTHWKENNFIRNDRYKPTRYVREMAQLNVIENDNYSLQTKENQSGIPLVNQMDTQVRLGKVRLGKVISSEKKEPKQPLEEIQLVIDYWNHRNPHLPVKKSTKSLSQNIACQLEEFELRDILMAIRKKPQSPKEFLRDIDLVVMMRQFTRSREGADYILSILQTPIEPLLLEDMEEDVNNFLLTHNAKQHA